MSIQFGPNGSRQYLDINEWVKDAKEKDFNILHVSSGPLAQTKNTEVCMGAWFSGLGKGWLIETGV